MKFLINLLAHGWWFLLFYLHIHRCFVNSHYLKEYIDLFELHNSKEFYWNDKHVDNEQQTSLKFFTNKTSNVLNPNIRMRRQAIVEEDNNNNNGQLPKNRSYGSCRTTNGEDGTCRPILYCRIPELEKDIWRLVSQLCVMEKSSIGICCPTRARTRLGPQIMSDSDVISNDRPTTRNSEHRGCGMTTKTFPQVLNGRPAEPEEWPWMVAILLRGVAYVWCGGALITDRHVLTAAHCIYNKPREDLVVRLGEYDTLLLNETRARDFRVGAMITHIDYNPTTYENDIALIRVERPTIFNTYIWPICIPSLGNNFVHRDAIVTGWGSQQFGGPHAPILMEVSLPIWHINECRRTTIEPLPETILCAGLPNGGQDSCQGDSGGPLMIQLTNQRWITVGIVSWGVRCGEPNRPGMYTRVDRYISWIYENTVYDI